MTLAQDGNDSSCRHGATLAQENKVLAPLKTNSSVHNILPSGAKAQYNYMQYIQKSILRIQNIHTEKAPHNKAVVKSCAIAPEIIYHVYYYWFFWHEPGATGAKKKPGRPTGCEKQLCNPCARGRGC
jgi:hypothetical protein